ncbi:acyltransferase family protein [Microbacterium sp.]|uniref:acyltransferase family protein n=1 Tax=Microbacterium sp. TaxID=51671 RepID=UPI0028126FCD|nr:acyltransferase family protein [Microbacterium sp.]
MDSTTARGGQAFRTDVQGLRAIAVGLVLLYHAGVPGISGGYIGVDVFFVISGFLISTHLLQTLEREGRIHFADFYARRIRRILPASLTVAAFTAVAAVLFYPPVALERVLRDALATILYVPNIWFAVQETDYLADHSPSPYQHYWSLGVEEQFYLLWPLVLLLLFLLVRRRRSWLILCIIALTGASLVAGAVLTLGDQPTAFFSLPTRAWELLVGALVAVLLRRPPRAPAAAVAIGGWAGVAMVLAGAVAFDSGTAFPGVVALVPTVGTALVIFFGATPSTAGPTTLLSIRPMQFVGLISYSLYLVHWPLLVITHAHVGEERPLPLFARVMLGIVLALPLAWLLFRFVETPLRSPRMLTSRRPRATMFAALGLSILLTVSTAWTVQWASVRDLGTSTPVALAPDFPAEPPVATEFVPQNLRPALDEVADDLPRLYADGCRLDVKSEQVLDCVYGDATGAKRIAVFGDSHSAQWFPAIDELAGRISAIRAYTKSSCPAAEVTVLVKGVPYSACDRWREKVLAHLVADPPDVVVISNFSHYPLSGQPHGERRQEIWKRGLSATVERLRAAGIRVLIIADTPQSPAQPPTCLSADVADVTACDIGRDSALDEEIAAAERAVAQETDSAYADLTRYICDAKVCPAIIFDLQVYRDVNHLTSTFVRYLAPALRPQLAEMLDVPPASLGESAR